MPKTNGGNINFNVNMTVNKNGLNQILKPLQQIQSQLNSMSTDKLSDEFSEAASSAKQLESIINSSWNDKLGQLNLDKFNQSIKNSYGSVSQLKNSLAGAGSAGESAFNALASQVLNTNLQLKESNKLLDEMATSMANTVKWGITSSIFNNITSSIQQAFYYAKDLDRSLNSIRIVTGDSADEMDRFAKVANNAAKDLGRSTLDYTDAALSFYQQGLSDEQVQARTNVTLKAQNITGTGSEMADYLTAVWNGFKVNADETENYVDKLAKVADSSASNMSELAIAMSKVAATANVMGVDVDQLTAQIATVIATTRQAPESVGTAFKTIYSRLNDIKTGADDAEISLGNYSGKMAELGFNVLDANGRLRDTGQVMEQIGSRWNTLSREQQIYLAQTMGGMRQVTQITALFENWTTYSELLNQSLSSQGSLNEKNNIYLESTAAYMEKLGAETERTYDILFNQDTVNGFASVFTGVLNIFNDFIEGIGGGANVFLNLGAVVANVFSKQIGSAINTQIQNIELLKNNLAQTKAQQEWSQAVDTAIVGHASAGDKVSQAALEKQAAITQRTLQIRKALTQEQYNQLQNLQREVGVEQTRIDYLEQYKTIALNILDTEDASTREFQERLVIQQQTLQAEEERANVVARATQFYRQNVDDEEQALNLANALQAASNSELLTEQQKIRLAELQVKLEDGQKITEQEIKEILELQNNAISKQRALVEQVNQGLQGRKAAQNGTLQQLKNQQAARERIITQQQEQAARQIAIQNAVRRATGIVQALSSVIGGISTRLDKTASASQRANGVWSAISGGISGTVMAINPALGMLTTGILGIGKSLLEVSGIWDTYEEHLKSTQEKVKEFNQSIREAGKNNQQATSQIAGLEQIKQQYEQLSNKAGQYGSHLDRLTEEEKTRYHELTNKFTQYNQAVIVGYDEQGNAIVRGQQALLDTIEILKQAKKQANAASLGSSEDVLSGISATHSKDTNTPEIQDAKERLEEFDRQYKMVVSGFQNKGNETAEILSLELTNYGNQISETIKNSLDFEEQRKVYEYIIGENGQTFQQLYNQYLESINDVFNYADGQLKIDEDKLAQTLSLGNILKDAIEKYVTTDSGLDYYNGLLSNYNEEILNQMKESRDIAQDTYNELVEQANATVNYTQQDANAVLLAMATFDDIGSQYQKLQQTIENLGLDSNLVNQVLSDYITSFTDETSIEQVVEDTQAYAATLQDVFSNTYDVISKALTDADFDNFEGTVKERTNKAIEIINEILAQLNGEDFETEESRQALANILASAFDLTGVEIQLNKDNKLGINANEVAENVQDDLKNAQHVITETLKGYGYEKPRFATGLLNEIFSTEELADINNVIDQINWGSFLKYVSEGMDKGEALKKVLKETKEASEQLSNSFDDLDFNTIFNSDEVIKHLEASKKLTEEEQKYLNALEQQDGALAKIAANEGRNSANYIKQLKLAAATGQQMYKTRLEASKKAAQEQLDDAQAIINQLNKEDKLSEIQQINRQNAEQIIIQKKQEIIGLNYQIASTESTIGENVRERAKAERDAAIAKAKTKGQIVPNAKSALSNLQNGSSLSSEDANALAYFEQADNELNKIAKERGIYSQEYTAELTKQIQLQSNLTQEAKQEALAAAEQYETKLKTQKLELENKLKDSGGGVSEEEYKKAKSYLSNQDNWGSTQEVDAVRQTIKLYEDQAIIKQGIKDLDQKLIEASGQRIQAEAALNGVLGTQLGTISAVVNEFNNLGNKLTSGETLSVEQMNDFTAVLDDLVQNHYPELQNAADTLKETWLAGTEAYSVALREVGQALDQLMYNDLLQSSSNAFEELEDNLKDLSIGIDPTDFEEFTERVEDYLQTDKTITIAVHTDAENEFQRITAELDNIYNAAGKIGENFIVAADDIRELNNVFPGILQGMQMLDDGSVQLNSGMVQRAIATAQATSGADAQAVQQQLQNQSTLLHNKANTYKKMAEAAGVLAGSQVDSDMTAADARAVISDGLATLQAENEQRSAENQMENQKTITDSSKENSEVIAENWRGSSQSSAESIYQFAQRAIDYYNAVAMAAQAASNEQIVTPALASPAIAGGFTGSGGSIKEASVLSNTRSAITNTKTSKSTWANLQNQYTRMYQITEKAANDIDGMIATVGAKVGEVGKGLQNVASGKGIKGSNSKDKSKSSSKSPSSKSGKSGGKGKNNTQKEEKSGEIDYIQLLEDERDRYHDIDIIIKTLNKDLDNVQKTQKKLYGKDLIDNLNQQVNLLEKQVDAYEKKIDLASQERDEIRTSLRAQGVLFDPATGVIANYSSAMLQQLNHVNNIIAHYNTLSSSQQQNYKATVEKAKEDYENFKKQIERYDELVNETLPELRDNIRQARDKQTEIAISKFNMAIEIELDLSKAKKDWNDFKKKIIDQIREDDILGNAESAIENLFAYYDKNNRSTGLIPSLTNQVLDLIDQLDQVKNYGSADVYGDNEKQALEDLQKYSKELMNSLENVDDIIKEVKESFYDMIDAAQDAFDEQVKEYNFLSDLIDHDKKLIQLLYGDDALDKLKTYNQKQIQTDKRELDFQRHQKDFWYARMEAQKNRMQNLDKESNAYKEAQKRFKELEQHWLDAVKDFNSQVENSIQHLLDQYQNNVGIIFQSLNKALTNNKGLEYIEEQWELINDNADQYLDTVNSMYEIQKLQDAFQNALEDSEGNLKAQKSLTNLMNQQLKMLRDKDKLTKYDVDRANLLLQIEIKRLALEQSRNNKSKLRLRRDNQGNYSYQYIADEQKMAEAEQELADARNSLYNLDKDQYIKNQNDILSIQKDFNEKLKALYEQYPIWTEEAEAKRQLLIEQYGMRINNLAQQNQNIRLNLTKSAFDELASLYDTDVDNFINMSRTEQDELMSNLIPQWNSGVQAMTDKIAGQGGFIPSCQEAFDELDNNTKDYEESLKELQDQAGVSFSNIENGIDLDIIKTESLIEENKDLINTYGEEWRALESVIQQVERLTDTYKTAKNEAIAAAKAANDYITAEQKTAAIKAVSASQPKATTKTSSNNSSIYDILLDDEPSESYTSSYTTKKTTTTKAKKSTSKASTSRSSGTKSSAKSNSTYSLSNIAKKAVNSIVNTTKKVINDVKYEPSRTVSRGTVTYNNRLASAKNRLVRFDSGGYTGDWENPDGKLAVLHEKELVLNAKDTENILSAVQTTRDMSKLLKLVNINDTLSSTLSNLVNQNVSSTDQKVYITAQFPAVNSRVEIEEAFSNLINRASQYSFNTRK